MNNDSFTIKSGSYETTITDTHFDLSAWYPTISKLSTPINLVTTSMNNSITVSWDTVQNAATYTVYYKKSSDNSYETQSTSTNSISLINLVSNVTYNIYVKANAITEIVGVRITANNYNPVYVNYTYTKYEESNNSQVVNQLVGGE